MTAITWWRAWVACVGSWSGGPLRSPRGDRAVQFVWSCVDGVVGVLGVEHRVMSSIEYSDAMNSYPGLITRVFVTSSRLLASYRVNPLGATRLERVRRRDTERGDP